MSPPDEIPAPAQLIDSIIDRLVDGELRAGEREALLRRLDVVPGGWRRCALAFLEAQAWRQVLCPAAEQEACVKNVEFVRPGAGPGKPAPLLHRSRQSAAASALRRGAIAAGLAMAFASGWCASGLSRTPGPRNVPAPGAIGRGHAMLARQVAPGIEAGENGGAVSQPRPDPDAVMLPPSGSSSGDATAVPPADEMIRRRWERQGFRVEQRSGLMSMDLNDGRSVTVPVDEVELRYVGDRTY